MNPETDTTKDIDALLAALDWGPGALKNDEMLDRSHAALTGLIAERNALKQRVAELEAQPPASDLRERLVCAALTGLCADPRHDVTESVAVAIADRTLAAMRKGDTNA